MGGSRGLANLGVFIPCVMEFRPLKTQADDSARRNNKKRRQRHVTLLQASGAGREQSIGRKDKNLRGSQDAIDWTDMVPN